MTLSVLAAQAQDGASCRARDQSAAEPSLLKGYGQETIGHGSSIVTKFNMNDYITHLNCNAI